MHLYLTVLINVVLFSLGQTPPAFAAAEVANWALFKETKSKESVKVAIIFERI